MPAVALGIISGEYEPVRSHRPDLPDAFVQVLERAMHADVDARTPSARAFSDDLLPFLGHGLVDDAAFSEIPFSERGAGGPASVGSTGGSRAMGERPVPSVLYPLPPERVVEKREPGAAPAVLLAPADPISSRAMTPPAREAGPLAASAVASSVSGSSAASRPSAGFAVSPRAVLGLFGAGLLVAAVLLALLLLKKADPAVPDRERRVAAAALSGPSGASVEAPPSATTSSPKPAASQPPAASVRLGSAAGASSSPAVPTTQLTVAPSGKKGRPDAPIPGGKPPLHRDNPY